MRNKYVKTAPPLSRSEKARRENIGMIVNHIEDIYKAARTDSIEDLLEIIDFCTAEVKRRVKEVTR